MTTPVDHKVYSSPAAMCSLFLCIQPQLCFQKRMKRLSFFFENITFSSSAFLCFYVPRQPMWTPAVSCSCNINFCLSMYMFYMYFNILLSLFFFHLLYSNDSFLNYFSLMSTDLSRRQHHQTGQHSPGQRCGPTGGSTSRYHLHQTDCLWALCLC